MVTKKPGKQRKAFFAASLNRKHRFLRAHLSKKLREEYGISSLPVRKEDTVKIMRGDNKGTEGVVQKILLKKSRIYVAGVTIAKADGSDRFYPVHPSNVMITRLELKDEKRKKVLER